MASLSPAEQGFRIAGDTSLPGRFWLPWPAPAERDMAETVLTLAGNLARQAPVTILANPADVAMASLRTPPGVGTLAAPHDGIGLRHAAPLFLVRADDGALAALVDASGQAQAIALHLDCPIFVKPDWLSGDFVDIDGTGILLASTALVAGDERLAAERSLLALTGANRVVWLETRLGANEGALAPFARCLSPGVVAVLASDDATHPFTPVLDANRAVLAEAGLSPVALPMPPPVAGARGLASYTAMVVTRQDIVVPVFGAPTDRVAADILAKALPDRPLIPLPATGILAQGADLAALTVIQPAPKAGA